ncbi:MAG: gephyrin-like molybdotransferase Glp [Geminicoccaceae bacterium]
MSDPGAGDCFAFARGISVRQALDLLRERTTCVVGTETVGLDAAIGRILARSVTSPRDVPAFDNAAVDGWAFAHRPALQDESVRLDLVPGRAAAGHPFAGVVPAGSAVRVLTGAVIPEGADTVAMQEATIVEAGSVLVPAGLQAGANRRRAGEHVRRGQEVLAAGHRLRAQDLGLLAELGLAELPVRKRLRVAVFSSGDELADPRNTLPEGGVFDANRPILKALLTTLPVTVTDLGIMRDDVRTVREAMLGAAAAHDLLMTSGGASRGDEDHVVKAVGESGRLDFWQIAMKPGRPLAFGRLGEAAFVGLPGNPVATMVGFLRFARPVILALAGGGWREPIGFPVRAGFSMSRVPGRTELLRATLERRADGSLWGRRVPREGSNILASMVEAEGLIEIDAAFEAIEEGQTVPFLSFAELGVLP